MEVEHIILIVLGVLALAWIAIFGALIVSLVCYLMTFYSPSSRNVKENPVISDVKIVYYNNMDKLVGWRKQVDTYTAENIYIKAFDGLKLHGKYYKFKDGAPIELLVHGYRGSADRDMNGGVVRAFENGRNAFVVDNRASGESQGHTITFGVNESRDLEKWIEYIITNIDKDAKIILAGVSMGAATVLITCGKNLPKNVVACIADCGYTSQKEMIMNIVGRMKLPPKLMYPFIKLGAGIFGHFDIDETTPFEMVKKSKLPIIFYHGENDTFVPFEMSKKNFDACPHENKKFVPIKEGGHGASYLVETEYYTKSLNEFLNPFIN